VIFTTINGGIRGLTESQKCPVTAHFDGVITLSKIGGTLRYRWERSTGANGPVQELAIPAGAHTAAVDVAAAPDEWPLNQPGQQLTLSNRIHVLAPVDAISPPVSVDAKCY
jgi:hypothetical protein